MAAGVQLEFLRTFLLHRVIIFGLQLESSAAIAVRGNGIDQGIVIGTADLRACLISSDEDGNEGESKNLSRNNEFTLTIFPKPAEFVQPAEKALYHPTTRQHNKSV